MFVAIAIFVVVGLIMFIGVGTNEAKKTADASRSTPEKATVKKVMAGENGTSQVVFEKLNGERVNLVVPHCTFLEGETGMLKYSGTTFDSFSIDSSISSNTDVN